MGIPDEWTILKAPQIICIQAVCPLWQLSKNYSVSDGAQKSKQINITKVLFFTSKKDISSSPSGPTLFVWVSCVHDVCDAIDGIPQHWLVKNVFTGFVSWRARQRLRAQELTSRPRGITWPALAAAGGTSQLLILGLRASKIDQMCARSPQSAYNAPRTHSLARQLPIQSAASPGFNLLNGRAQFQLH